MGKLIVKNNYILYKNGPFIPFYKFIFILLNPFNWEKISKKWLIYSFKEFLPKKFKYPKKEFDYFMCKFQKRIEWFKEFNYVKNKQ